MDLKRSSNLIARITKRALSLAGRMVMRCVPECVLKWMLDSAMTSLNSRSSYFMSYWTRPKSAAKLFPAGYPMTPTPPFRAAIVVQGPLALDDDFTLETLAWYRHAFPDSPLILSTWDDSPPDVLERACALGVHVIASKTPEPRGPSNLNLQSFSTLQGILKARELNATHVVKTRADQRIYSRAAITQLLTLQQAFPLRCGGGQKERIVALSYTLRYAPYHLCDFLIFGQIDDMALFWSAPPDPRPMHADVIAIRDLKGAAVPEIILCSSFLNATGWNLKWTVSDSWNAYRERFCVIDFETLDMYWAKGERLVEHRNRSYEPSVREMMGFLDWLALWQLGVPKDTDVDSIMDLPINPRSPEEFAQFAKRFVSKTQ